ncbi:LysR family transcriptional regulator [Methylobacterium sp. C1]|uniref:LysR family transcriptional regulator n=1 Tax=Methylobacterium sp. C1 TaxID=1479019 RepID=UPI0008D8FA45|nr:LysR family transcriptional regulator [Methylobacterium sp. C1]
MNLRSVDLNLLVILDALLAEQNVSRAGERLGLTQSATSAALSRLRLLFDDPLLTPVGRRMELTAKAESLIQPLRDALAAIEGALAHDRPFDPSADARTFSISASDYAILILLAPLVRVLSVESPNITIHLLPRTSDAAGTLRTGKADIVIEPRALFGDTDYPNQKLFVDRWVCAVDRQVGRSGSMSKEQFLKLPHLIYSIGPDKQLNTADMELVQAGVTRRVEVTIESFLLAPFLIQGTNLVSLVLERAVRTLSGLESIVIVEPPYPLNELEEMMYWHPRYTSDPAHVWLRQRIAAIAGSLG